VELNLEGRLVVLGLTLYRACTRQLTSAATAPPERNELLLFAPSAARRLYFEMFALPPVKVNFSFARRDLNPDDAKAANEVRASMAWLAASVDNAPLELNGAPPPPMTICSSLI
jgi:hypothetical protein